MKKAELIAICDRAIVHKDKWHNRESFEYQMQVSKCRGLLLAGCDFKVDVDKLLSFIRVNVVYPVMTKKGSSWGVVTRSEVFELPTKELLDKINGNDWLKETNPKVEIKTEKPPDKVETAKNS